MRSVNKVILIGNLTRDPEMRQTPNNQNVTTFGLATNRAWVTQGGEKKDSAEFHECVAWARLAEICSEYLKRGNLVYVEGYLKTRNWESPEGIKKFKTEIVVQDMIILEKRSSREEYANAPGDDMDRTISEDSAKPNGEEFAPETEDMGAPMPAQDEEQHGESPIDKDLGL
jgi:single-strand DNA-binding protein